MLEELSLPYKLHSLPFPPRVKALELMSVNPLGTVPAIVIEGQLMTESAAIVEYLAARFGQRNLAIPIEAPNYMTYLNFLHMGEATLTFPQTLILRYSILEPDDRRLPQVVEDYRRWFLARLKAVQKLFAGSFTCGENFTAADVSVGYAIKLACALGLKKFIEPQTISYFDKLTQRSAYQRAVAVERLQEPEPPGGAQSRTDS
jgi:glutathione S-transferase